MINYTCPKCGTAMSSPDSMAGQPEKCPACGNICNIPERRSVVWIARVYDKVGTTAKQIGGFCSRRWKLVTVVGVNLILLTGFLSWFLPDWLPRPMVTFETPSKVQAKAAEGLFPSRAELVKILEEHGYYPALPEPAPGILRGRHLHKFVYVQDINNPSWAYIEVWCPLDTKEKVIAVSTVIISPKTARTVERLLISARESEAVARLHMKKCPAVIKALSSISIDPKNLDFEWAAIRHAGNEDLRETSLREKGFELEIIGNFVAPKHKGACSIVSFVLKDKSWR